jgi:hypothetical protein
MTPRFTLVDLEAANAAWGCNCGPSALAVIAGLTLKEVRPHMGASWPGYTNPTLMFTALRSALGDPGPLWRMLPGSRSAGAISWPRYGLCRIQWEGPWTQPGANPRWGCRFTHWVGVSQGTGSRGQPLIDVFDVNTMDHDGPFADGWGPLDWWTSDVVPSLTAEIKRASGGWHITHAIEVER